MHSLSNEIEHKGELICILSKNQVWRIGGTIDADGNLVVDKTMIFRLRILQDVRSINVYDEFSLVIFEDESVLLALSPDTEGSYASYNRQAVDVSLNGQVVQKGSLHYDQTPI